MSYTGAADTLSVELASQAQSSQRVSTTISLSVPTQTSANAVQLMVPASVTATPGARDLVMLWRIYQLSRRYELVVVDLPASGNATAMLGVPLTARRLFDAGPAQHVHVHTVANEAAATEIGWQPAELAGLQVEHGDVVPITVKLGGQCRTNAAAAHDQDSHPRTFCTFPRTRVRPPSSALVTLSSRSAT